MLPTLNGATAAFINIYLEMVNLLLNFLHFLRVGNCERHLETIREFHPYCFSLNRHNYARIFPYYYSHMLSLKKENLGAFQYLPDGGFTGSLKGHPFIYLFIYCLFIYLFIDIILSQYNEK